MVENGGANHGRAFWACPQNPGCEKAWNGFVDGMPSLKSQSTGQQNRRDASPVRTQPHFQSASTLVGPDPNLMQGLIAINKQNSDIKEQLLRMEALLTGLLPSNGNPFPKTAEVEAPGNEYAQYGGAQSGQYGQREGVTPIAVPKFGSVPTSQWH